MQTLKEIFNYRQMIFSLVQKEVKGRYKGSVLGVLWTFVNPLLQLLVYTFVFSIVLKTNIEKYYLFLFVALIPWLFFSQSLCNGSNCIFEQKDLVKKIYFPRLVVPIAYATSYLVNMLLSFVVIFAVLFLSGVGINIYALFCLPLVILGEYLLCMGTIIIVSSVDVYLRDLQYILNVLAMAWMYLTPIMYDSTLIPEEITGIYNINPMKWVIDAYRDILYYKRVPDWHTLGVIYLISLIIIVLGCLIFDKLQRRFAEEL